MQRIFDIENEEDMKLLWSILPENVVSVELEGLRTINRRTVLIYNDRTFCTCPLKIDFKGKEKITRPVNYESIIGCVCKFSTCPIRIGGYFIGILDKADNDVTNPFHMMGGGWFEYCEPVKKSELKFYGD